MNERIKQLADQCWDEYPNTGPVVFNKEKFAQLIVRECALQCRHNDDMDRIEKHFGVEL